MNARTRAALLWGVVSALTFLVLAQGYRLFGVGELPLGPVVGGALAVFAAGTLLTYRFGP